MKKILWILSISSLIMVMLVLSDTYGLFETNGSAEKDLSIGRWVILVNDNDISLMRSITLSDFIYSSSSHTEDNYFAPGRSAQFDIVIDTSSADVSVVYDLSIDDSAIDDYPNIYFSITDLGTNQVITNTEYSGVVLLSDANRVKTLRISLNWVDDINYDESDTSLIGESLSFVINANFKQYLGE